jgi:hypothetical protein
VVGDVNYVKDFGHGLRDRDLDALLRVTEAMPQP